MFPNGSLHSDNSSDYTHLKDDEFINAVDKFGPEVRADLQRAAQEHEGVQEPSA